MKTEQTKTEKVIDLTPNQTEKTLKIAVTAISIMAITWLALKISKQMLKELEGMGL
jgi:hypothetical protein